MRILVATTIVLTPAAAAAQAVTPGQWDIAVTTTSIAMPSMPPEVAKSIAGRTTRVSHCITPADAARGPQDMLKSNKSCAFSKYSMVGGRMHAEMSCKQPGGTMNSVSDGVFTPTGFRTTARLAMSGATPMTMTTTTVGKRGGACR